SYGSGVHLVVHHMAQFQHIDDPHGGRLVETLSGAPVVEVGMSESGNPCLIGQFVDLVQGGPVKDRGRIFLPQFLSGPAQYGLIDLSDVHPGRYAQWVQHNVHGGSIVQKGHVLLTDDPGNDTFVPMASRHLVPYLQLTLLGDVYLGQLHDSGRKFVPYGDGELVPSQVSLDIVQFDLVVVQQIGHQGIGLVVRGPASSHQMGKVVHRVQHFYGVFLSFRKYFLPEVVHYPLGGLPVDQAEQFLDQHILQLLELDLVVHFQTGNGLLVLGTFPLVLDGPGEQFLVDDHAP